MIIFRGLTKIKFNFTYADWEQFPKSLNPKYTKRQKRMLYNNPQLTPLPRYITNMTDTLFLPHLNKQTIWELYSQLLIQKDKQTPFSSQYVSMLIYNFAKNDLLTPFIWNKIQPFIHRNRGQFSMRSVFGGIYGTIILGKPQYTKFFLQQTVGQRQKFSPVEAMEIIQAFNKSKYPYQARYKFDLWQAYFKSYIMQTIRSGKRLHSVTQVLKLYDAIYKFQYFEDEQLWNGIFEWTKNRRGWKRIQVMQRLYPLTGTFQKAKQIFDQYYAQLSSNPRYLWRYNFEQLRLYTSQQMIKKSQQNIQMFPFDRTLVKRKDQVKFNQQHRQWLANGEKQKQQQLVKDKAQSLAYAIKNRYDSMRKDKADFSKLSVEQFQDLFGQYNPDLLYQEQQEQQKVKQPSLQQMQQALKKQKQKKQNKQKDKKKKKK